MGKTGSDYTSSDFDNMPYLTAFIKVSCHSELHGPLTNDLVLQETLRFHPIVYNTFRVALENDVLPLLDPITTETGEVLNELPIPKGTKIITSIAAYNRFVALSCLLRMSQNASTGINSSLAMMPTSSIPIVG